jgi:hypothetical protein
MLRDIYIYCIRIGILPITCTERTTYRNWRWYGNLATYDCSVTNNFGVHKISLKLKRHFSSNKSVHTSGFPKSDVFGNETAFNVLI